MSLTLFGGNSPVFERRFDNVMSFITLQDRCRQVEGEDDILVQENDRGCVGEMSAAP